MKHQRKQKIIRTTLEIGVITLLIVSAFNIINSIYINPGDAMTYQIDSPLETYVFEDPYNLSADIQAVNFIVFNTTGFNITSTNPINIQINHIDSDIIGALSSSDDLVVFTVTNSPGSTWFNISGFDPTADYTVEKNSVLFTTVTANATGSISFQDTPSINDEYGVFWVSGGNQPPTVTTNQPTNIQEINVTINGLLNDDGGENCTVTFEWGNISNPLGQNTSNQSKTSGESFSATLQGITNWYNTWNYRKNITIDYTLVDADLVNYPVLVSIASDPEIAAAAQADGDDILFINESDVKLNHEIEYYNSTTGQLICWVNVTEVSSTVNTTIRMYYGNASVGDQQNKTGVWDSGFSAVWHMNGTTNINDSTINYNNLSVGGTPVEIAAKVGVGQDFEAGDSDYFEVSNPYSPGDNSITLEGWVKLESDVRGTLLSCRGATGEYYLVEYYQPIQDFRGIFYDGSNVNEPQSSSNVGTGTWYHVSVVWNATADLSTIYIDGVADGTGIQALTTITATNNLQVGAANTGGYVEFMDGVLDEVRISNVVRDPSWLLTSYNNMNDPSNFITVGSEEYIFDYGVGRVFAGTLYTYRARANNSVATVYGDNVSFLTRPYKPELLAALSENRSAIQLTWVQIALSGANNTYIERNTISSWILGSGTEVYNDTGLIYNDTGLGWGTRYYYQAWSYANYTYVGDSYYQYSLDFDSASNQTNSLPVFSNHIPVNGSVVDVGVDISLTISDPDGDTFNWTIDTSPDIGNSSANNSVNGTVTCSISPSHNTSYTWFVNATDGFDWINRSYNFTSEVQFVAVPINGSSTYHTGVNYLNLSWDNHSGINDTYKTDNYVVVQRNDTYAESATQSGNWIRQNNTMAYFNTSWTETSGGYFTIFGYNDTVKLYSYDASTPLGLDIPWGAIAMQCFDEITHESLIFDVLITNSALETYAATNLSNIHYLDLNDIPFGTNTIFYVSNGTHESRTYYHDLELNTFYNLTFYLPLALPPGGVDDPIYDPENETYSTLYLMTVIDERDATVQDVRIQIMRYINETDTYENVTILRSDANGQADVYLFSGTVYKVNLSKSGYITRTDDWIPSDSIFTKTFKIYFEETEPSPPDVEPENIIFTGEISETVLFVNYTDNMNETVNTSVYVYEINLSTGLETLFGSYNTTDVNSFQTNFTNINSSNTYKIILFYSHTTFGDQTKTLIFDGTYTPLTTPEEINNLLTLIVGTNPYGWANFFIWLFLVAGFYYADPKDSGKILVLLGGLFLFINLFVGFNTTLMSIAGGAIPVLFIAVGIIMMWNESHKKVTG